MKTRVNPESASRMKLLRKIAVRRTALRLCPLFFNDELLLRGEGPEEVALPIQKLLDGE